jgi:YD repeat-containing protein
VRSYDPAGNLASLELFAGTPSRAGFRYDFRHDAAGRLTEAVSHRDRISRSWRYSQNGYPVSISARRGQEILQASLCHYDHDDRIRYSVDQSRTLSAFEYDSSGRIARLRRTDARGKRRLRRPRFAPGPYVVSAICPPGSP